MKPCKFGKGCLFPKCTFVHPEDRELIRVLPTEDIDPHLLKDIIDLSKTHPSIHGENFKCTARITPYEPYYEKRANFIMIDKPGTGVCDDAFYYDMANKILHVAVVSALPIWQNDGLREKALKNPLTCYDPFAVIPRIGMTTRDAEEKIGFVVGEKRNALVMRYDMKTNQCRFEFASIVVKKAYTFDDDIPLINNLCKTFGIDQPDVIEPKCYNFKGTFVFAMNKTQCKQRALVKYVLEIYNECAANIVDDKRITKFTCPMRDVMCLYGQMLLGNIIDKKRVDDKVLSLRSQLEDREEMLDGMYDHLVERYLV